MIDNVTIDDSQINLIPQETNVDIIKLQNQKAIECLKELEHYMLYEYAGHYSFDAGMCQWIDNKIKELENNNE